MPNPVYFAGFRGTSDFGTDERPKSFRETILRLWPEGSAPLFALTEKMNSEKVSDPEFNWWNERMVVPDIAIAVAATTGETALTVVSGGRMLRPNQVIQVTRMGVNEPSVYTPANVELMMLSSVTSDTQIVAKRGQFGTTAIALTTSGTRLTALGTAFGENSLAPAPTSRNPVKFSNYTQIFRHTFGLSRTADSTTFRTGQAYANDRERTSFDHSAAIEQQFLFGIPFEGTDSTAGPSNGKPLRITGGLRHFLQSNVKIFQTAPTHDTFLEAVSPIWNWNTKAGGQRIGFCGNGFLREMNKLAMNSPQTQINHTEVLRLFGMKLNVWQFPQGEIGFRTHPLMNQNTQYQYSAFIVDPWALQYRYLLDTKFQENLQTPGQDGMQDGWITECGLEVLAEETCAYIGNFRVSA